MMNRCSIAVGKTEKAPDAGLVAPHTATCRRLLSAASLAGQKVRSSSMVWDRRSATRWRAASITGWWNCRIWSSPGGAGAGVTDGKPKAVR